MWKSDSCKPKRLNRMFSSNRTRVRNNTLENYTFPARFLNIFVDYLLGQMHVGDKLWMNWNKAPMRLWQTQLNFVVWCTSSACGVSSAHLNYTTNIQ